MAAGWSAPDCNRDAGISIGIDNLTLINFCHTGQLPVRPLDAARTCPRAIGNREPKALCNGERTDARTRAERAHENQVS